MGAAITADELIESLTGYDELAISKSWGAEVFDLANNKQTTFLRSLVFIHMRREGQNDSEAKKSALSLTLKEVNAYFVEAEADLESGEGEGNGESEPTT